ncbi:CDP-diacylglycerol--glycerol-3-phosphate 3-phosphatidyltransferase [Erysipelotrichaceae bacterium OttesenSCG-928-M19]|nr:CDP-diacylglycerol--glycerol-3-phosphate 3-phosphatidyltransferase [Erysipelotrichaceae bacterium OttesenSCG-928-M19]
MLNTATKITIFRIILIPLILIVLLFPYQNYYSIALFGFKMYLPYLIALVIFAIAALSDAVDGHIARTTNTITNLGKFLDPVADKLLVNTLLIFFTATNHIPVLVTILMISRDTIVDALRLICVENNIVVAASKYGKLKTVFQMVTICLILLFAFPDVALANWLLYLIYLTTFISVASGIDYFIKNRDTLRK